VPATAAEQTIKLSFSVYRRLGVPGAGHLWLGRKSTGLMLLYALPLMFAIGLAVHGRLFRSRYPSRWSAWPPS
jgi:hypothetical protein